MDNNWKNSSRFFFFFKLSLSFTILSQPLLLLLLFFCYFIQFPVYTSMFFFLNRHHPFLYNCVYKFNFTYHCIIIIIFSFVLFTKTTLLNSTSKYKLCLFFFYYSTCWRWCVTHRNVQIKKNDIYHHLHHFPNSWLAIEIR